MNRSQRVIAISLIAILLLMGFAIGRLTKSTDKVEAEGTALVASSATTQPAPANETSDRESNFYLSDFKVGYNGGYKAGLNGQNGAFPETSRSGYNDGYKQGYGDALQNQVADTSAASSDRAASVARASGQRVAYRTVTRPVYRSYAYAQPRHHGSKLRKVLTIAAPAAIGAGLGALFGGKKGAGVGALLGGGGGAVYLLTRKHRN